MKQKRYDVFISYSRRDYLIVDKIVIALNAGGFTYIRDQQSLESGMDFSQSIINAINSCKLFLCVLSENAYSSEYVVDELMYALQNNEDMVLPIIVDNSRLPKVLQASIGAMKTLNWQFSGNFDIEKLIIQDINTALGRQKENMSKIEKECNNIFISNEIKCDTFLSYSRKDYDIVKRIKQEIEQATKAKCWMDLEGISYESPDFTKIIAPAIEKASIFIFVLTPNSQESRYARNELLLAKTRNKHIFFVEPRECEMTSEFILEYGHYNKNLYYVDYQKQKLYEELSLLLDNVVVLPHLQDTTLYRVEKNGLFGFEDKDGRLVVPYKWANAGPFINGRAYVEDRYGNAYYIDKYGDVLE